MSPASLARAESALERSYQAALEAQAEQALAANKLHASLRADLLDKLGDSSASVPAIARRQKTLQRFETTQPVVWAICDALDAAPAAQALHAIFRPGTPDEIASRVLALKSALAKAHADVLFGEGIKEIRGV